MQGRPIYSDHRMVWPLVKCHLAPTTMRTQLHFILLVAFCYTATAQTLTDATSIPAVGHNETREYYNASSAPAWNLTGTGNTWDATSVVTFGVSATVSYRAPVASPFAAAYPATTLCAERFQNGNTEWRHYLVDAAHAEMIGISAEDFSGGRTYCNFPFTIGNTFTDDRYLNGNTYSDTYTYVASGEVLAPWGTISDVVMFETSGGFSYYLYLANNLLDPIGGYTPGFGIDLWKVDIANGISDTTAPTINLWPNPTTDELVIDGASERGFTYRLADMRGQLVHSGYATSNQVMLDLRSCAAGVYTVQVTDARGRLAVEKVVVE